MALDLPDTALLFAPCDLVQRVLLSCPSHLICKAHKLQVFSVVSLERLVGWDKGLTTGLTCMQAAANSVQVPVVQPLCSGGNNPSSERSTGSHASGPPSASLGSQLSSEPSGSPGGCSARGCANDHGLLNLAAAAEQGWRPMHTAVDFLLIAVCACLWHGRERHACMQRIVRGIMIGAGICSAWINSGSNDLALLRWCTL